MRLKLFAACAIALVLAACSEPAEPTLGYITFEPEYDKFGAATCPANTEPTIVEAGRTVCKPTTS